MNLVPRFLRAQSPSHRAGSPRHGAAGTPPCSRAIRCKRRNPSGRSGILITVPTSLAATRSSSERPVRASAIGGSNIGELPRKLPGVHLIHKYPYIRIDVGRPTFGCHLRLLRSGIVNLFALMQDQSKREGAHLFFLQAARAGVVISCQIWNLFSSS